MHVESLKRGDIILNATQTADLLRSGKAAGQGKAYASGTTESARTRAYAYGTFLSHAYANGSVTDEIDKIVDWFEILVDKLEHRVELYEKRAENAAGLSTKNKYIQNASKDNDLLLKYYKEAKVKYKSQSESVAKELGLSPDLKDKVEKGTVNFEKLNEDDKKKVEAYQKWYEKIRDCDSAIEDLKKKQKELSKQKLDNIVDKYDNLRSTYEGNVNVLDAQNKYRKEAGFSQNVTSDYYRNIKQQQVWQEKQSAIYKSEISAYKKQMKETEKKFGKKSPEYKDAVAQLKELETAYWDSKTAAVAYRNELYETELQLKKWKVEKFNRSYERQTTRIDYLKATDYKDSPGITEKDYTALIKTNNRKIMALADQKKQVQKMMAAAGPNSENYNELADQLADIENQIVQVGIDTEEWRKAILELRLEPFYDAQDALDEVITDFEVLRSMLDSDTFLNDDASFSEYGLANIALLNKSMDAEKQKIANYKQQLENIQKLYDNGSIRTDEYEQYTKELLNGIRSSSKALSGYNQNILDMYEQQITKENQLLQTNISKRKEALSAKEDYYNYDKTLKRKSKDINTLKAQIGALEGTKRLSLFI